MSLRAQPSTIAIVSLLWLLAIIFSAPIIFVVLNSFKDFRQILINPTAFPTPLILKNYASVWRETHFYRPFLNSIFVSATSTTSVVLLTAPAAYKLARTQTWYSRVLYRVLLISMMVPFQTVMIPMVKVASGLGLYNRLWSLVVIYTGYTCGFSILLYHSFTSTVPREIEESAMIDGATQFQTFRRIVFPLFKPISATLIVIYVVRYWNDLLLPLILVTERSRQTIPLSQLTFFSEFTVNRWNLLLAAGVMAALPAVVLYIFAQKYIIRGLVAGAVKA